MGLGTWALGQLIGKAGKLFGQTVTNIAGTVSDAVNIVADVIRPYRKTIPESEIIGLRDPVTKISASGTLTDTTDYASYPDKAILKLTNSTGSSVEVTGISIVGKVVRAEARGFEWEYTDYESVETDGEIASNMDNEYLIDPSQLESVGDYLLKASRPRPVYTLSMPGCHYEYEKGSVWHLTLSYTIPNQTSEAELIDTDVEILSASFSRSVGGIGETLIDVTPPLSAWTKTTSRRARLISSGAPKWLNNRGNTLTVAASTWTGQADYFCDGTDDDVEIQAAIDLLSSRGGGEVSLTNGIFNIYNNIEIKDNIYFHGDGSTTIIRVKAINISPIIDCSSSDNIQLSDFTLDGNKSSITNTLSDANGVYGIKGLFSSIYFPKNESYYNIHVMNIKTSSSSSSVSSFGFYNCSNMDNCISSAHEAYASQTSTIAKSYAFSSCAYVNNCRAYDIVSNGGTNASASASGFSSGFQLSTCLSYDINASNSSVLLSENGFSSCSNVTLCVAYGSGSTASKGYYFCSSMQQNKANNCTTKYNLSYSDSGTSNVCADTYQGGFNS